MRRMWRHEWRIQLAAISRTKHGEGQGVIQSWNGVEWFFCVGQKSQDVFACGKAIRTDQQSMMAKAMRWKTSMLPALSFTRFRHSVRRNNGGDDQIDAMGAKLLAAASQLQS